MKAIQLMKIGEPLQDQKVPLPVMREGDVLVKIEAAGICHSDAHYRAGKSPVGPLPQILGHEVAGIVDAVGEGVSEVAPGDKVALNPSLPCGACRFCLAGAPNHCLDMTSMAAPCGCPMSRAPSRRSWWPRRRAA